ncbi:restriction endonuclease subunit S [Zhongshania sp. BJYM1]|uniref:restriction endonuclease subunit S n=1 Tax=Zhongshania aquatica TaxID=2965069 RepID=UPI0022B48C2D|nr:restriction endonuclease subunit S [Marortus sp. BJYM1]
MSSFQEVLIGDVCSVGDGAHSKVKRIGEGVPYLTSKNIGQGELKLDKLDFISEESFEKLFPENSKATRRPRPGDVLFGIIGTFGNSYLYKEGDYFGFSSSIGLLRPDPEKLDSEYLYYVVSSEVFKSNHANHNAGSVQGYTNIPTVKSLPIPLPPLAEQKRVSKILKSLDEKIKLNRQANQTLEHIAQAIFKSWFVDFDPTRAKIAAKQRWQALHDVVETSSPTCYSETDDTAKPNSQSLDDAMNQAAMTAISGKNPEELQQLSPEQLQHLQNIAALFPDALVDSELGEIPEGWGVKKIGDVVERLKPKKRYTKKQIEPFGAIPVYEQGADILLGFHNGKAGFSASADRPLFIFGDHTCVTHLSCEDFDISQNVIPLAGSGYPTIWVYYAIQGRQEFQEYRRHWAEFIINEIVSPAIDVAEAYSTIITTLYKQKEQLVRENKTLEQARDSLLPKLLSGEIETGEVA